IAMLLVVARIEPVEQRGAGPADMQKAGRRGGKTDGDAHGRYVGAAGRQRHRGMKTLSRGAGEGPRSRIRSVGWPRTEIVALADRDGDMADDVVGRRRVELHLQHREMIQVVLPL